MEHDLRAALGGALPSAGLSCSALKAMDDTGYKADPKNNDMKELFVALNIAEAGDKSPSVEEGEEGSRGRNLPGGPRNADGSPMQVPSAAQALLDYRREKKAAQEATEREAAARLAAGAGKGLKRSLGEVGAGGVGLAHAAGVGSKDLEHAAGDDRFLRKLHQSRTAAKMSSRQKRRRKQGKAHGTEYEQKYDGKVLSKNKRKARMLAMKQMW